MEAITLGVNWLAVIVGAVAAFMAGSVWYSQKMFGRKWANEQGLMEGKGGSMVPAMLAQAIGTFLLAWVIGVTETTNNLFLAILVAFTYAILLKANGLFTQKSKYVLMVDVGFIFVMVAIMIIAQGLL